MLSTIYLKLSTKRVRTIKIWIISALVAIVLFIFARPTAGFLADERDRLSQYLAANDPEVGVDSVEGESLVYYLFEDKKYFITKTDGNNAKQPSSARGYITFVKEINGEGQVFLHHILSNQTIQLTSSGTNLSPKVNSTGKVVWEGWDGSTWQLFVYDGTREKQITFGDLAKNADIEGEYVVYARKSAGGLWRSEGYSFRDGKRIDISIGNETEYPKLTNREIFVGPPTESQIKYPLKIDELFVLDLAPLDDQIADTSTLEEILTEIEALEKASVATDSSELIITEIDSTAENATESAAELESE